MSNPFGLSDAALGDLSLGLKVGDTVLSGLGEYMVGQETAAADEYNADLIMSALPITEYQIGEREVDLQSTQRAMYAKAGVTMTGSPLEVMLKGATDMELDKSIAKYNAESQANMYRYKGEVAKNQAKFNVGKTLLGGALSLLKL